MRRSATALVLALLAGVLVLAAATGKSSKAVDHRPGPANLLVRTVKPPVAVVQVKEAAGGGDYDFEDEDVEAEEEEEEGEEEEDEEPEEVPHTTQRSKGDKKKRKGGNRRKGSPAGGGGGGGGYKGGSKVGFKKHLKKYMLPLLMAYKLKFLVLIPLLIGGLILIVASTGFAGFFFALFAVGVGLKKD